jgi:hypothetical protein
MLRLGMRLFSHREGYSEPIKIKYRDEIPVELRLPIAEILERDNNTRFLNERADAVLNPYGIDAVPVLRGRMPAPRDKDQNDSDAVAFRRMLFGCAWFQVYDIIEDVHAQLVFYEEEFASPDEEPRAWPMQQRLNEYFIHAGIGWKMVDGKIVSRQEDVTDTAIETAEAQLEKSGRITAAQHIKCSLHALSERPKPNTSGAVAHATNAVECVLNDITGKSLTLGKYLDQHSRIFHPALKKALDGVYGFASDAGARHGKEGVEPAIDEAYFVVITCAATCTLLDATYPKSK